MIRSITSWSDFSRSRLLIRLCFITPYPIDTNIHSSCSAQPQETIEIDPSNPTRATIVPLLVALTYGAGAPPPARTDAEPHASTRGWPQALALSTGAGAPPQRELTL